MQSFMKLFFRTGTGALTANRKMEGKRGKKQFDEKLKIVDEDSDLPLLIQHLSLLHMSQRQ